MQQIISAPNRFLNLFKVFNVHWTIVKQHSTVVFFFNKIC